MQSLETMFHSLNSKIAVLNHVLDLSGALGNEEYIKLAANLDHEMNAVTRELHLLKIQIQHEKEKLLEQQDLKLLCEQFKEHLIYTSTNLPPKLPHISKPTTMEVKEVEQPESQLAPNHACLTSCEYLRLLTTCEFQKVPKYIKGRLQYDKVNSIIEKLNGVFVEKYKILKSKKKCLNEVNRKKCEAFKSQESKDTKGMSFIVDKDIEDFSNLKMDNTLRNVLTILRHCGLMQEIRGGGFVRYSCFAY